MLTQKNRQLRSVVHRDVRRHQILLSSFFRDLCILYVPSLAIGTVLALAGREIGGSSLSALNLLILSLGGAVIGWLYARSNRLTGALFKDRRAIEYLTVLALTFEGTGVLTSWVTGAFDNPALQGVPIWVVPLGLLMAFVKNAFILWIGAGLGSMGYLNNVKSRNRDEDF